jgi:hypothetical protein
MRGRRERLARAGAALAGLRAGFAVAFFFVVRFVFLEGAMASLRGSGPRAGSGNLARARDAGAGCHARAPPGTPPSRRRAMSASSASPMT